MIYLLFVLQLENVTRDKKFLLNVVYTNLHELGIRIGGNDENEGYQS